MSQPFCLQPEMTLTNLDLRTPTAEGHIPLTRLYKVICPLSNIDILSKGSLRGCTSNSDFPKAHLTLDRADLTDTVKFHFSNHMSATAGSPFQGQAFRGKPSGPVAVVPLCRCRYCQF